MPFYCKECRVNWQYNDSCPIPSHRIEQIQITNPQYGEWLNRKFGRRNNTIFGKYWMDDKQEQIKMTREEAYMKVNGVCRQDGYSFVRALEALGLLKFDEAPKKLNKVFQVTKEVLQAIKDLIGVSNENNFVATRVGDFVYQSLKEEAPKKVLIEIGKFTRVEMTNGSFFQGKVAHIDQD